MKLLHQMLHHGNASLLAMAFSAKPVVLVSNPKGSATGGRSVQVARMSTAWRQLPPALQEAAAKLPTGSHIPPILLYDKDFWPHR